MGNEHAAGSANGRTRLFSAAEKRRILSLVPGKPSGVTVTLGGIEFNLVSLSAGELIDLLEIQEQQTEGKVTERQFAKTLTVFRSLLYRSAVASGELDESDPESVAVFDEWYRAWDPKALIEVLMTAVAEANGVSKIARPQMGAEATATSPPSTPPAS